MPYLKIFFLIQIFWITYAKESLNKLYRLLFVLHRSFEKNYYKSNQIFDLFIQFFRVQNNSQWYHKLWSSMCLHEMFNFFGPGFKLEIWVFHH